MRGGEQMEDRGRFLPGEITLTDATLRYLLDHGEVMNVLDTAGKPTASPGSSRSSTPTGWSGGSAPAPEIPRRGPGCRRRHGRDGRERHRRPTNATAAANTSRLVQSLSRSTKKWFTWSTRSASIQPRPTV